ncbi:MAG: hypothetical protein LBB84_00690 [Tannerellaceae bacterium]|jgi:hypothetical protein|nr:hypothetical protein [Tannerellaceae bacterium]
MKTKIAMFAILLIFFSCKKDDTKKELSILVKEWQGKEIVFPDSLVFTRYAADTIDYRIPDSEYKVLAYVDSVGCTECVLNLQSWINFIESVDTLTDATIPFLFFFHPKEGGEEDIYYLLEMYRFELPVCVDMEDKLNRLNKFPENSNFHFFLLDKNNKVLVAGNPVYSDSMKKLYVEQLKQQETEEVFLTPQPEEALKER